MSLDRVTTSFPNGIDGFMVNDTVTKKTANYTVLATTDCGKTFVVDAAVTFTLPALSGAAGCVFTFVNLSTTGTALTVSPNAADFIGYANSVTDDKDIINTGATAVKGDQITLAAGNETTGWQVVAVRGIWAKEA